MPPRLPTPELNFCGLDAGCYAYMLYNWQTLIGGLVALFAAFYAGRFVRRQIAAGERIEAERLRKRGLAARAVLPLSLARFVAYADACAALVVKLGGPEIPPASVSGMPLTAPPLPLDAVADLERTIEATDDDRVIDTLTRLAGHTQMLHSILTESVVRTAARGSRDTRVAANLPAWRLRVALVHAAASSMFKWARGDVDRPDEVGWAGVEKSLAILALDDGETASLMADARARGLVPLAI